MRTDDATNQFVESTNIFVEFGVQIEPAAQTRYSLGGRGSEKPQACDRQAHANLIVIDGGAFGGWTAYYLAVVRVHSGWFIWIVKRFAVF